MEGDVIIVSLLYRCYALLKQIIQKNTPIENGSW